MPQSHRPLSRVSIALTLVVSVSFLGLGTAAPRAAVQGQAGDLRIAVIQGEDSVNIIQQKTAVATIVEVRDRNNLPVAGASVVFLLGGNAGTASLNNGVSQVTLTTNAAGRASVTINPLSRGAVQLEVRATYQGQTATTTIAQTNFQTAAQAAQAGRAPVSSGGESTTSTTTATGSAGGATGGGLSTMAIAGIAGGAVAGAVVYKKITANNPPVVGAVTASPATTLLGFNTPVAFSVDASDPDNDPLTFKWDFGDGGTSTDAKPTHVYNSASTFTVKVTVSDGKVKDAEAPSAQGSATVKSLSASWRSDPVTSVAGTVNMVFALTQTGGSVTGQFTQGAGAGPISAGSIKSSQPQVTFTVTPSLGGQVFQPFTFTGNMSGDFNSIIGALNGSGFVNQSLTIVRQ